VVLAAAFSVAVLATALSAGGAVDTAVGASGPLGGSPEAGMALPVAPGSAGASQPVASCTATPSDVHPDETVTLDASASTDASYVEFDKEPDETYEESDETDFVVNVTYAEAGTYEPRARASLDGETDTDGCGTVSVTTNEFPNPEFTYSPDPGEAGRQMTFDASNSSDPDGEIVEYRWDFDGDGTTETTTTDPVITHTYAEPGTYYILFVVEDDDGATAERTKSVTVTEPRPEASCSASPTEVEPGESVTLDASNTTDARYVEFDKEPNGSYEETDETDFVVTVSYDEPGTYKPQARAWNGEQFDTDDCGTVTVSENDPPDPEFTFSPSPGSVGQPVTFDASNSVDPDGNITEYRWDFNGDGTIDETTTDPVTSYTYGSPQWYVIELVVEDDDGATARTSRDVRVTDPTEPEASCTASPQEVTVGEEVTLDASASEGADDVEFDKEPDGTTDASDDTDFAVTVTYDEPGTYEPEARVWNYTRYESSTTVPCGPVTVTENDPPVPRLSHTPRPATAGQPVSLDASASSDPDGTVVEYRWDFDNDGTIDRTTNVPTTERTFPYDAESPGVAVVGLVVVDDDGATARVNHTIDLVRPDPAGSCAAEPTTVAPGEEVTLDASESENAVYVEFDAEGNGEFTETDETDFRETVSYDEPGTYEPQARVTGSNGEAVVVPCDPVEVADPTPTPTSVTGTPDDVVARCEVTTADAEGGRSVTVDASDSENAEFVRVDFEGDGTYDVTDEEDFRVETTVEDPDTLQPRVLAVGAAGEDTVECGDVTGGGGPTVPPLPWPWIGGGAGALLVLGLGAWLVPKALPLAPVLFGSGTARERRYATGLVRTSPESGTVPVTGVGFQPDVVYLTATTNAGDAPGNSGLQRTDGWSYGAAVRTTNGSVSQHAVSANTAPGDPEGGVGTANEDAAVDLVVHTGGMPGGVTASVESFTPDGFDLSVDVLGEDGTGEQYPVLYQAVALGDGEDVELGHFRAPPAPGTQTVSLGVDANHVSLAASNTVDAPGVTRMTDLGVGLGFGDIVDGPELAQTASNSTVTPAAGVAGRAAFDDRAVHLLFQSPHEVLGRTYGRATGLGTELELEYWKAYSGPSKVGSTDRPLVTYTALDLADRLIPAVGQFSLPRTDADGRQSRSVEVGFEPGLVELWACDLEALGTDGTVDRTPLAFGLSHGTVIATDEGDLAHYLLHSSTDPFGDATAGGPTAADGGVATARHTTATDTTATGDAAAAALVVDEAGTVAGRDDLAVTAFTDEGFDVSVTQIRTGATPAAEHRRVGVFYKVWPAP